MPLTGGWNSKWMVSSLQNNGFVESLTHSDTR